jgi:hypothetical protein
MIIALFLMLIFARFTWLLLQHLEAESQRDCLGFQRRLLERCLYRTTMIQKYEDEQ